MLVHAWHEGENKMSLLKKLTDQIVDGDIKSGDTIGDWLDTLEDDDLDELERLVALLEEEPEDEETVVLGQLVVALYAVETGKIDQENDQLVVPEIPEDEFFKLLNSFLFLLPFFYWGQQGLVEITPAISLVANQKNEINVKLVEYGKGELD
jgi:hypothetical protein